MGSQVDMYTCTDACASLNQGVGLAAGSMGNTHSAIHGHPGFHLTMHRSGA